MDPEPSVFHNRKRQLVSITDLCIAATAGWNLKQSKNRYPVVHIWPVCDHHREGVQSTGIYFPRGQKLSRLLRNKIFILTRNSCRFFVKSVIYISMTIFNPPGLITGNHVT